MWWFIGSSYIPSVLRGAGPVQPPIEGSSGCSEWSLQKIAFDFSLAANAVPHNERALGILHMIYRKLPKIHPSHPPLFAHYFEAKVGREGGGGAQTFISTVPCDVTLVTTAVSFWKNSQHLQWTSTTGNQRQLLCWHLSHCGVVLYLLRLYIQQLGWSFDVYRPSSTWCFCKVYTSQLFSHFLSCAMW